MKNIILCFDGTGNEFSEHNTNIVKIFSALKCNRQQVAFYDPGVGTFSFLGRTLGNKVGRVLGKAFGAGLCQNLEDGYEYLMNHYEPGDKVFLFGFSRGAFTARAFAGMLYYFGILEKGSKNLIPYVSKMYTSKKLTLAQAFKQTFCHDCPVHFIGVFDTVSSLGLIHGASFYDSTLNPDVANAYQAIALDEKRKKFPISIWDETKKTDNQNICQVWFSGSHSDIGGSYPDSGLSDITLGWMLDNAAKHGLLLSDTWQSTLLQNFKAPVNESYQGLWKIWNEEHRVVPVDAIIHQSVINKFERDRAYTPYNFNPFQLTRDNNPSYLMKFPANQNFDLPPEPQEPEVIA